MGAGPTMTRARSIGTATPARTPIAPLISIEASPTQEASGARIACEIPPYEETG